MEVEFSLTEADFVAFAVHHAKRHPPQRTRTWIVWSFLALLTLLAVFNFSFAKNAEERHRSLRLIVIYGIVCVALLFLPLVIRLLARKSLRRQLRLGRNTLALAERKVRIAPDSISEISGFGTITIPWTVIPRIDISTDHAFIYGTETSAHIIPSRAFASRGDFTRFMDTAKLYHEQAGLQKWSKSGSPAETDRISKGQSEGDVNDPTQSPPG